MALTFHLVTSLFWSECTQRLFRGGSESKNTCGPGAQRAWLMGGWMSCISGPYSKIKVPKHTGIPHGCSIFTTAFINYQVRGTQERSQEKPLRSPRIATGLSAMCTVGASQTKARTQTISLPRTGWGLLRSPIPSWLSSSVTFHSPSFKAPMCS